MPLARGVRHRVHPSARRANIQRGDLYALLRRGPAPLNRLFRKPCFPRTCGCPLRIKLLQPVWSPMTRTDPRGSLEAKRCQGDRVTGVAALARFSSRPRPRPHSGESPSRSSPTTPRLFEFLRDRPEVREFVEGLALELCEHGVEIPGTTTFRGDHPFYELARAIRAATNTMRDWESLRGLGPPGTASRMQLHEYVEADGSRPFPAQVFTAEDWRECSTVALEVFELRHEIGDGGRAAMIGTLRAATSYLSSHLPTMDLAPLRVLLALVQALVDAQNGVRNPVLKLASGGNRHSQRALDLKARSLILSEIIQERGCSKEEADKIVLDRIRSIAPLAGLKLRNPRRQAPAGRAPLDNWRADERRDARRPEKDPKSWNLSNSLSEELDRQREHLRRCDAHCLSVRELLDFVLGIEPSMLV